MTNSFSKLAESDASDINKNAFIVKADYFIAVYSYYCYYSYKSVLHKVQPARARSCINIYKIVKKLDKIADKRIAS